MKLKKNLRNLLFDPERKLNERVYILMLIVSIGFLIVALVGDGIYNRNVVEMLTIGGLILLVPFIAYLGVRYNKLDLMIKITSLIIMIAIPVVFLQAGGAEGAAILWYVFYFLYIGLVMTGWWRIVNLFLLTVMVFAMFVIEYLHPEIFKPYTRWIFYIDTSLAVIEIGFVCFIMTWFQNRQFMQENNRAKEETRKVEELNRSQTRFFSSMSHEIRTPINSILGLNEIILRNEDATEEIKNDAENIQGAGRMLLALINDILDFSRIEAGRMDIVPINYSVPSMLSEIVNMIWLGAQQKGLEFKIEVDPSIPLELYGDEVRIKQILVNLLNNAVKYTKEGSVTLRIEKEDSGMDSVLMLFSVIDTGIGIKQDALPYLFDAFERLDEEKNVGIEGTGLGLTIVKQLVDLMGGKITVNSVYTQGTTFMVSLWQKVTNSDAVGEISIGGISGKKNNERYTPGFTAQDARILIVDDNKMNLMVEKKLLEGTGITIDTVMSGEEALSMTISVGYDLILMDHFMPEMDGIECMQLIRKQSGGLNNQAPIIALTANAGSEERELYTNSGFDGYLLKPVSGRQLEETILQHLPENKVIKNETFDFGGLKMNATGIYSHKIPVLIATNTSCDIPMSVISEQQIDTIPYSIHGDGRIFYDGTEAGADEVLRYMRSGMEFKSEPPSVFEFERFFGRELMKAHNVIYITASSTMNDEFARAETAAKAYGNVTVFDSGFISGAIGLLVLMAHRMSVQGSTPEKIIEELEAVKARMHLSLITDGSYFTGKRDVFKRVVHNIVKVLSIRPFVKVYDGKYSLGGLTMGDNTARNYEKYVNYALPRLAKPESDLLLILYADMGEEELKRVEEHIRKRFDFENIVFEKASATYALSSGPGSMAIVYFDKGVQELKLSRMLMPQKESSGSGDGFDLPEDTFGSEESPETASGESGETSGEEEATSKIKEKEPEKKASVQEERSEEPKWYEKIPGVDGRAAFENSGSEETLREMLWIFYDSIRQKSDEIRGFYDNGDWENYTIKVHALKSSAKLIGAGKLADDALALENAGNDRDIEFIKAHTDDLLKDYEAYSDNLGVLFAAKKEKKPADRVMIDIMYDTIREAVDKKDADAIRGAFDEIEQYELPAEDYLKLEQLKDLFEGEDYDGMSVIIDI